MRKRTKIRVERYIPVGIAVASTFGILRIHSRFLQSKISFGIRDWYKQKHPMGKSIVKSGGMAETLFPLGHNAKAHENKSRKICTSRDSGGKHLWDTSYPRTKIDRSQLFVRHPRLEDSKNTLWENP